MNWISRFLMFLGRVCIGVVFAWAAVQRIFDYQATVDLLASKNIQLAPLFVVGASVIELLGSLSVVFGYRVRLGAFLLLVALVPITLVMHDFWMLPQGEEYQAQAMEFFKNLSIFGGLLYVLACGRGEPQKEVEE